MDITLPHALMLSIAPRGRARPELSPCDPRWYIGIPRSCWDSVGVLQEPNRLAKEDKDRFRRATTHSCRCNNSFKPHRLQLILETRLA